MDGVLESPISGIDFHEDTVEVIIQYLALSLFWEMVSPSFCSGGVLDCSFLLLPIKLHDFLLVSCLSGLVGSGLLIPSGDRIDASIQ